MFNTHFSWQHQKGTRQVKQIYLACFEASSELALKLLSMQLPMLVCDFVTPITEHGRYIYLCARLTPHIQSYWSDTWSPSITKQLCLQFCHPAKCFGLIQGNKNSNNKPMWPVSTHVATCINCLIPAANIFNIWPSVSVNLYLIIETVTGTCMSGWELFCTHRSKKFEDKRVQLFSFNW